MKFQDILSREFVLLDITAKDIKALFGNFAKFLSAKGIIKDEEKFSQELLKREAKGSTAIGNEVAIPHIMIPGLNRSYILIARLKKHISFDAPDGKPVRFVILLISPKEKRDEYLHNLAQVASALHREDTLKKLTRAVNVQEIIAVMITRTKDNFFTRNSKLIYCLAAIIAFFFVTLLVLPRLSIPNSEMAITRGDIRFNEIPWVTKQIWASTVFFGTVLGTLLFWQYRVAIAACGLGLLLISGTMDLTTAVTFMSIPTILFIISMMVMVAWLKYLGFFKYIVIAIINKVGPHPRHIFLVLMFLSVLLGGLTGEVTGILIMSAISISVCNEMRLNPFPFIISLIFSTNIGSALTLIGNPIGIYIAFSGNLTFEDFLRWATPLSLISTILISALLLYIFKKKIPPTTATTMRKMDPWESVFDRRKMKLGCGLFIALVILIGFSKRIEDILFLMPNTALVALPLLFVGVIVFFESRQGKFLVTEGVDWWTILFFMFLFAKAACLEYSGVTPKFAYQIADLAQRFPFPLFESSISVTITALLIVTIFTAIASGFVDNLPIIAALVPIVKNLRIIGLPHAGILWWGLLFGGCFGGNLTMIGSSANMVALAAYEKSEGKTISFTAWLRYSVSVFVISLLLILILLTLQIKLAR